MMETPEPTRTWHPIPHTELLTRIEMAATAAKLNIVNQAHALTKDKTGYFGLLQVIRPDIQDTDQSWVLGIRNSHSKKFPAGLCVGSQVFVCDNLAFSGEVKISRKHTAHILRDLPELISTAIGKLFGVWAHQDRRVDTYKTITLDDRDVHDLTIKSMDAGVFCSEKIKPVLKEWREPHYDDFKPRNLWSFFNAVTYSLKGSNIQLLPGRTSTLYTICDDFALSAGKLIA